MLALVQFIIANYLFRGGTRALAVCVDASVQYIASGGNDGAIRIWRLSNRELVTQYSEHSKAVSSLVIDTKSSNIIHSCSLDSTLLSYDLKANRRIICHMAPSGAMYTMSQRKDSEQELITGDIVGRLLHWDIDYRDPVVATQDPSRAPIRCCAVSPTGLYLAFGGDDHLIKIIEIATGRVLALGQSHSDSITTLSWTPDEKQLVTGGDDCCLCIWNFYL